MSKYYLSGRIGSGAVNHLVRKVGRDAFYAQCNSNANSHNGRLQHVGQVHVDNIKCPKCKKAIEIMAGPIVISGRGCFE